MPKIPIGRMVINRISDKQSTEFMLVRPYPLGATQFQRRELLTAACLTEISVHFIIHRN